MPCPCQSRNKDNAQTSAQNAPYTTVVEPHPQEIPPAEQARRVSANQPR